METQAILTILNQCQSGKWKLITSAALEAELAKTPDLERLKNVLYHVRIISYKKTFTLRLSPFLLPSAFCPLPYLLLSVTIQPDIILATLAIAKIKVVSSQFIEERSLQLVKLGFSGYDAAHIASAERSYANIFLSTDDRLINRAQRNFEVINVEVDNPVRWLMKYTQMDSK